MQTLKCRRLFFVWNWILLSNYRHRVRDKNKFDTLIKALLSSSGCRGLFFFFFFFETMITWLKSAWLCSPSYQMRQTLTAIDAVIILYRSNQHLLSSQCLRFRGVWLLERGLFNTSSPAACEPGDSLVK